MNRFRTLAFISAVLGASLFACGGKEKPNPVTTSSGSGTGGSAHGGAGGATAGPHIQGLTAAVHAAYDPNGLLHLTCAADNDCFAALGYFHAQNRFFFMDFIRNLVRGKLGNLVKAGDPVLQKDYANRQWFSTRQGDPLEDALYTSATDQVRGHLDAYTRGVNAWIADMRAGANGATLTTEYDFMLVVKANIRDWEPQDSAAVGLYVLNDLSNFSDAELLRAREMPLFSPGLGADLYSGKPVFGAFTLPAATGMPPVQVPIWGSSSIAPQNGTKAPYDAALPSLLDGARSFLAKVGSGPTHRTPGDLGSNNWAVAPSRTQSGHAILANDPHLPLGNPSIWFPVEIDAKSNGQGVYHAAGSTFPGLPSIMVGHNESIAWGVTTAYYDLADEYLETLTPDGKSVVFNGQNVPLIEKTLSFDDASTGTTIMKTFEWVPHHGPVVQKDTTKGTAISIRWAGREGGTDLDAFFGLARSASVADAKQALATYGSSADQNFVIIDTQGNVGWFPYSKVPGRPWASATLNPAVPVPGDGTAEWQGWLPVDSLPQVLNPAKGFVATANNDMTGASADGDMTNDGVPAIQSWDKAEGTREQRIIDLIAAGGNTHSMSTMQAIQGDTYSLYGSFTVPLVLSAANGATLTANEQAVVAALTNWKFSCPTGLDGSDPVMSPKSTDPTLSAESIGCTAFHTVFYAIVREALGDEAAAAKVDFTASRVDINLVARALHDASTLNPSDNFWDDVTTPAVETRDDILRRAITDAAVALAPLGGPDEWRWGRVHTLSLRSIYDSFGLSTYNYGPFAAQGGQFTVNVATPINYGAPALGKAPDFAFSSGPSIRCVFEASPSGFAMSYELPGGTDLHRESPFYNNLLPLWLDNKPIDFPFGPGAVPSPALVVVVTPGP